MDGMSNGCKLVVLSGTACKPAAGKKRPCAGCFAGLGYGFVGVPHREFGFHFGWLHEVDASFHLCDFCSKLHDAAEHGAFETDERRVVRIDVRLRSSGISSTIIKWTERKL